MMKKGLSLKVLLSGTVSLQPEVLAKQDTPYKSGASPMTKSDVTKRVGAWLHGNCMLKLGWCFDVYQMKQW